MNEPMRRILIVLPMYGGSLPIGRYCGQALRILGHVVEYFEAPGFHSAFSALKTLRVGTDRLDYLENSLLQVVSQAVLAKVEAFAPDLVLAMAQAPLSRQALKRLQRDKVPTAMWFVEDHEVFPYWKAFAPLYDTFAVIQKGNFPACLSEVGQPNAFYLPLAADPSVHHPLSLSPLERRKYGSELSFVGAGYPNRRLAFRQLINYDLRIWGNDWDGEYLLTPFLQRNGQRIDTDEIVRIFNASTININLHSSVRPGTLIAGGTLSIRAHSNWRPAGPFSWLTGGPCCRSFSPPTNWPFSTACPVCSRPWSITGPIPRPGQRSRPGDAPGFWRSTPMCTAWTR